jgi:uncharacterized protein (DUF885 family)
MTPVLRLSIAILFASTAHAAGTSADGKVSALSKRYIDGLFRARPHLATFMGDHRFDGELPDFSSAGVKKRLRELAALDKEAAALKGAKLSDDARIDVDIVKDGIALERLYAEEIRDWEWDPRLNDSFPYYDPREIVAGRLSDIIRGDFATETVRRRNVGAQLAALPRFLRAEQNGLLHPAGKRRTPKVYCEHAIKGNKGRIEFFETELKEFTKIDPAVDGLRQIAVDALKRYQTFLEKELLPVADGDWRLGEALYAKKFPLALQTDRAPAQVVPQAEASFKAAREELLKLSLKLHQQLWPKDAVPVKAALGPAEAARIVNRVKDELAKDHCKPDDLVAAHGRNLEAMRTFIEKHDLVALPPKETLLVETMPAFKRGSSAAEYLAPGVLDRRPAWHATYYVDPIDPAWPKERIESYLRGQNNYEVQLVATHEAYPGHHTQYFYSKRNLDPLRAVLWNAAMVEGWAVYGEGLMVALGYGDKDNERFRFYDLRGQMITAANLILDVKLQSGQMTDEEAVRFMVEDGFQEKAMAEKKLLRAKLDSTQLAQYFLGLDEIRALEVDYRKKVGGSFSQRAFDDALIGHGSIAVKFLRRYLLP